MSFKSENSLVDRISVAQTILSRYPDRIPVIVESTKDLVISKKKFLVPVDLTVAKFIMEVRKHTQVGVYDGLFVFVDNALLMPSSSIYSAYDRYKDEDGFLYVMFSKEISFGCPK